MTPSRFTALYRPLAKELMGRAVKLTTNRAAADDLVQDTLLKAWARLERKTHADGARPRTEVLWINSAAAAALGQHLSFGEVA